MIRNSGWQALRTTIRFGEQASIEYLKYFLSGQSSNQVAQYLKEFFITHEFKEVVKSDTYFLIYWLIRDGYLERLRYVFGAFTNSELGNIIRQFHDGVAGRPGLLLRVQMMGIQFDCLKTALKTGELTMVRYLERFLTASEIKEKYVNLACFVFEQIYVY